MSKKIDEEKVRKGAHMLVDDTDKLISSHPIYKKMLSLLSVTPASLENIVSEFGDYKPDEVRKCVSVLEKYTFLRKRENDSYYVVTEGAKAMLDKELVVDIFHLTNEAIRRAKKYGMIKDDKKGS
jgi:hypothetical protein